MTTRAHLVPLVDLQLIAQCGLSTNPTITTYTFENGIERRRLANPMAQLEWTLTQVTDAVARMTVGVEGLSDALKRIGDGAS